MYLIVSAHIQKHRQALLGVHTSTGCVESQLAHWNTHSIATQVSKPQDPLTISYHNGLMK